MVEVDALLSEYGECFDIDLATNQEDLRSVLADDTWAMVVSRVSVLGATEHAIRIVEVLLDAVEVDA
jgi:hypothetical protein